MHDQDLILARPRRLPLAEAISYKFVSILLGLLAVFFLGELILRFVLPSQDRFYVWPLNLKVTLQPDPNLIPGISGTAILVRIRKE